MQSNYKLNCLVPGGDLSHIFEIKIAPTESVSALKELFKEKQKHAFRDVDANRLDLWKVDLSIDGTLEHNINNLELDPKKSLLPVAEMLEVFDNPPKRRHLHIVVKRPPAASPGPPVVPSFNLNCLVLGDDPSHIFEIKIAPTESVSALKKVIKAEKTPQFDDVPADHLTLWKIDINLGEDEQLDLPDDAEELKPVTPLSKVFLVTPEDEHLHIMVLRPPILVPPQYVNPPAHSAQGIAKDDRLYGSFVRPYVGEAVDGFFDYLTSNNKKFSESSRQYYGKFCSIVQSSGTGKSRLLTELRNKNVIVLYMNIRERSDSGFPAQDVVPSSILTGDTECSQAEYTARCCAFFAAIFRTLEQELSGLISLLRSGRLDIPKVVKAWNDRMCKMGSADRTTFFDKVNMEYLAILREINLEKESQQARTAANAPAVEETAAKLENMTLTDTKVEIPQLEGESILNGAYAHMLTVLPQIFTDKHNPRLVIAIDEAHPLSKMSSKGFRPSHILCRTINAYSRASKGSNWVVFASTTSQVAAFSAPQPIHDSLRVAVAGQLLYPPFTHLGWDQNADALSDVSANDVAQFEHIAGFGRPLWKSLMAVGGENVNLIMTTAAQKLSKSKKFDATMSNEALAVLSQRFALDIYFGHPDAVSYIDKGVASHLRICYLTTDDRTWSFTGYPSEPLLSCAAAGLLYQQTENLVHALDVLKKKVDGGMFEIGQSGELTSRLVLLLAKDKYVRKHHDLLKDPHIWVRGTDDDNPWKAELIDCQKVSVIHFLEHMFGDSLWSQAGDTAKERFRHAYINFSHWVPMDGLISPGSEVRCSAAEWTLRHWHRTSAVQCCHLQPLVDKMIPIYFDDPNLGNGDIDRVSQMFISDKAGKNSNERDLGFISRTHPSIKCLSPLPFIAVLLDLNGESKLDVSFAEKEPNHPETDRCLRIYASGVNSTTFPFLYGYSTEVPTLLRRFISKPEAPSSNERLHALVKYGSTIEESHMRWEAQRQHVE